MATVNGVKSLDGISLEGNLVTISNASLNQGTVTVSEGYILKLGDDVTQTSTEPATWSINGTTATYKSATTSAGYKLDDNQITYVGASGGETLATVNGVKSLDGISLEGNLVTISNASLNQGIVTVSEGYTLKLGDDVTEPVSKEKGFGELVDGKATYSSAGTSEGYTLAGGSKTIKYVAAVDTAMFTVSGITQLTLDGFAEITGFNADNHTLTRAPTDAKADGDNLVVTTADGDVKLNGLANSTINLADGDKTYTAAFDRIVDTTDANAKSVTLTSGFEKSYYGMHYSYSKGVTTVDATNANTTSLSLTGFKSEVGLNLKGADEATNTLTGGKGDDTLTGGNNDDLLKGNAGKDTLPIQSVTTRRAKTLSRSVVK